MTQKPETLGYVVPSKVYGIMAAGRPVLYIGPAKSTPARIIEEHACGWRVEPGDTTRLIQLLHCLESDRGRIREAGAKARDAFDKNYDKPQGVARIIKALGLKQNQQRKLEVVGAPHESALSIRN